MNRYDKAILLSRIDDDMLTEKKQTTAKKTHTIKYVLSMSVTICLIVICLFLMYSLPERQNTIHFIDKDRIMSEEIRRIEDYYDTIDTASYFILDNDAVIIYKNDTPISSFSNACYKEAMEVFHKFHLKKINYIYVNETTYVIKGEKQHKQYFIPFYSNRELPKEYAMINSYQQLPDISDFISATQKSINNSSDISYGSGSFILLPK